MSIKVIDLFSGVGGVALGLKMAQGFETLLVNDVDPDMCDSFRLNFPEYNIICDSIAHLDFKKILGRQKVDLIMGGPPCQAYSTSGKRLLEDPRAFLYKEYFRCIDELRPKVFVYENVKGLLSMANGTLFKEITALFASLGYRIQAKILNTAQYGVPQERERVIIVGTQDGYDFQYPQPTHGPNQDGDTRDLFQNELKPYVTLANALSDLPLIESGQAAHKYAKSPANDYQSYLRAHAADLLDHNAPKHGESLMNVIRHVPEGGLKNDIPLPHRPKSGYPNSYGRLWWNRPSTTSTRNFGTPSSARCIHPLCDRALTTREGARLQSFPDNFRFSGSRAKKNLQIGNAVPPLLAHQLALQLKKTFKV
jgi:DNA (cytosine-5)-methyltransferase 1